MKKLLSLTIIMTAFVICGCSDDEFRIGGIHIIDPETNFWAGDFTMHPGEEVALSYDIYITDEMEHDIPLEDVGNFAIQWETSNPEVARVIDGTVYGINPGIAVITVSISEGYWDIVTVYVMRDDSQTLYYGPLMVDLIDVTVSTAKFRVHFANNDENFSYADEYEYTFAYCAGNFVREEDATKIIITQSTDIELTDLWPDVKYSYAIYISKDNRVQYQSERTFVTDFPEDSIFDLSVKGTANCYVVHKKGTFRFKATEGNSESPASVSTIKVLWETLGTDETPTSGDLIEDIFYDYYRGRNILFKTNDTFKDGNALIAAYNSEGEITWSWHIWFTEQQPREVLYKNDSGTMMDRNLGALSSTPEFKSRGLFYQWGRKDPFIGSAKSTYTWPTPIISDYSRGTIAYSIAHPTTFICCYRDGEWDYELTSDRWTTSEKKKSKYDPCPVGWRVPDGGESGIWTKASGRKSGFYSEDGNEFGSVFGYGDSIYYPCAGFYDPTNGKLDFSYHCYWSSTPKTDASCNESYSLQYATYTFYGNNTYPTASENRATGAPVRCMKE